jgi:hypothetical protein
MCVAKAWLFERGVPFDEDFHALPRRQVDLLLEAARIARYSKPRNAPGSKARMFYYAVGRKRCGSGGSDRRLACVLACDRRR